MRKNQHIIFAVAAWVLIFAEFIGYRRTFYDILMPYVSQVFHVVSSKEAKADNFDIKPSADVSDNNFSLDCERSGGVDNYKEAGGEDQCAARSKIENFINIFNDAVNEKLPGRYRYIELNGLTEKIVGRDMVKDEERTVVRLSNGNLHLYSRLPDEGEIKENAEKIADLSDYCNKIGSSFIYVQAPSKIDKYNNNQPYRLEDADNFKADTVIGVLDNHNVTYLDLREKDGFADYKTDYFVTDHHWKPSLAFSAYAEICKLLNESYGFSIEEYKYQLENYNVIKYDNVFLGSQGKRVGKYYAGMDDIELIYPKFETRVSYTICRDNQEDEVRCGTYNETVIFDDYLDGDIYKVNPYAAYSGGDFGFSYTINNLHKDSSRVLLIRDSFACPVAAFMSVAVKELDIIDPRHYDNNIYKYINDTEPKAVIYLCNASTAGNDNMVRFGASLLNSRID